MSRLLVLVVLSWLLRPAGYAEAAGPSPGRGPAAPTATDVATPHDRMFIDQMVPHHQEAIDMSELALSRAEHPELRSFAEAVIRAQEAENAQMRAWRKEWFGSDVAAMPGGGMGGRGMGGGGMGRGGMGRGGMGGQDMVAELQALPAGEDFDRAFLDSMIAHHEGALHMAQMYLWRGGRGELQDLVAKMARDQQAEIDQMRAWRDEWYPDQPAAPTEAPAEAPTGPPEE